MYFLSGTAKTHHEKGEIYEIKYNVQYISLQLLDA